MDERRDLLEKLATYRDLSAAEQQQLAECLEGDPAAGELLEAYRRMDRQLKQLPDPVPDPALSRQFRAAVAREPNRGQRGLAWLGRAPALAGQVAAVAFLLFVVLAAGWLFRDQLQTLGQPASATTPAALEETAPSVLASAVAAPSGTPTPFGSTPPLVLFPGPTPTPAVTVDPADPFGPFADYMAHWPEQTGMAQGALRAGVKSFLQAWGGLEALDDPAVLAELEAQLRPHVPVWNEDSLQVVDVYPGGTPELVVAVLPGVEVFAQDGTGTIHVRGLGIPNYLPMEASWPQQVQVVDLDDGFPEIMITYTSGEEYDRAAEVLVRQFNAVESSWVSRGWRAAVPDLLALPARVEPVRLYSQETPSRLVLTCPTVGAFDLPLSPENVYERLLRQDHYLWNGFNFELSVSERATPRTQRQYANVAEAHLRVGDFTGALIRYRLLGAGETGLPAGAQEPDWRTLALLRAGQLHALLGEAEPAHQMLREAQLSSTQLGRVVGIFAEVYEESGDLVTAWAALLADGELIQEILSQQNGLAGGPGAPLALFYPGMALAASLEDVAPDDVAQMSVVDLLDRWQGDGLAVSAGRLADMDGDGALEIVAVQPVPSSSGPAYQIVSLLDHGSQGWFAVSLGEVATADVPENQLPSPQLLLPEPEPAPEGQYLLIDIGGFFAGWDGQRTHYYQAATPGYPERLRSNRPDHLCPLPALEQSVYARLTVTPTTFPPTEMAPEMTPTPFAYPGAGPSPSSTPFAPEVTPTYPPYPDPVLSPTPTPWDQEGMPTPPSPTVTPPS